MYYSIFAREKKGGFIMKGTTKIKNLGTIDLKDVSVENGRIEVYIPIKAEEGELKQTLTQCTSSYMKTYPDIEESDLYFETNVVFSFGEFGSTSPDFTLFVIIWQKEDESKAEYYDEIPITFSEEDEKKIKRIIWNGLGKILFHI